MKSKNEKVSIIVLNWNGKKWLKDCINSIKNQTYKNIEIILADNNSTDGSIEFVEKKWKNIVILSLDKNYGYTGANNCAAEIALGEYLFFLNNDTKLSNTCIENLINNYKEKSILAPKQIIQDPQNPNYSEHYFIGNGMDIFGYPFGVKKPEEQRTFYADGAAIFIKKSDFIKLGKFDEELFIFQEDIDLSWRAQLFGYNIITVPNAVLTHYSGGSVPGGASKNEKYSTSYFRRYLNEKNIIRNILKNYSMPLAIIILFILSIVHLLEILILTVFGKFKVVNCYMQAYLWNLRNINSTLKLRKNIQKNRIVSDLFIIKKIYLNYSKLASFLKMGMPKFT